jgi:hypothetical protein
MGFAILLNVTFFYVGFLQLLDKWNFFYEIHSILKSFFFSLKWPGFDPRAVHVESVLEKFSLVQVFL